MGIWFEGDIDYKCPSFLNPTEFGCSSSTWEHFDVYSDNIEGINKGIQKYKDLLKPFGVDASDMNMDIFMSMEIEDMQKKWNLNQEDAVKVDEYLYSFCFGCEILYQVQEKGQCHFYLPA